MKCIEKAEFVGKANKMTYLESKIEYVRVFLDAIDKVNHVDISCLTICDQLLQQPNIDVCTSLLLTLVDHQDRGHFFTNAKILQSKPKS